MLRRRGDVACSFPFRDLDESAPAAGRVDHISTRWHQNIDLYRQVARDVSYEVRCGPISDPDDPGWRPQAVQPSTRVASEAPIFDRTQNSF